MKRGHHIDAGWCRGRYLMVLAALIGPGGLRAQQSTAPGVLGEIVVTAQKRSEDLQKVPVAITAITSDQIEQAGIAGPERLQFAVPSMTFGNNEAYSFVTLRGIGNDALAGDPSVATYIDGVYIGSLVVQTVPNFDLERIEVLRGPQGTLYGRNADGGVVNYITRAPSFGPGGYASASYGNYNATQVDTGLTGPLVSDKIAARASFHYDHHDGYRHNIVSGQDEDTDQNISGRVSMLWTPTDALSITLRGDGAHVRSSPATALILPVVSLDGITSQSTPLGLFSLPAAQLAAIPGLLSPADLASLNGGSIASRFGLIQPGPLAPDPAHSLDFANPPGQSNLYLTDSNGASGTLEWKPGAVTLKSITAYRYSYTFDRAQSAGSAMPLATTYALRKDDQITQEFNLSGKAFADRLDWLAGAYYLHDHKSEGFNIFFPVLSEDTLAGISFANTNSAYPYKLNLSQPYQANLWTLFPNPLSTVLLSTPDYAGGGQLSAYSSIPTTAGVWGLTHETARSYAGFAQATYRLTDRLRLTGGFRFTADKKEDKTSFHSNFLYTLSQFLGLPPSAFGLCDNFLQERSWHAPTGTVGVDFDATDHILTYGRVSWGYKSGGVNNGLCEPIFNPEYLTAYESGVKAVFADNQILTNAAAYYYRYRDIQFQVYGQNTSSIANASKAQATGVELEYVVQPHALPGFRFDGSASYEHSYYGEGLFRDSDSRGPFEIRGNELIRAPRWKANAGAQYSLHVGNGGSLTLRAESAYTDTIFNDIFNGKAPMLGGTAQPAYWVSNARLIWASAGGRYEAQVFGNNLGNTLYSTSRITFSTSGLIPISSLWAPPRTYGARLTYRFGTGH